MNMKLFFVVIMISGYTYTTVQHGFDLPENHEYTTQPQSTGISDLMQNDTSIPDLRAIDLYRVLEEDLDDETSQWYWTAKQWIWNGGKVLIGISSVIIASKIVMSWYHYLNSDTHAMFEQIKDIRAFFKEHLIFWQQKNELSQS